MKLHLHLYCCVKYTKWKKLNDRKQGKFLTFDTNKLAGNFVKLQSIILIFRLDTSKRSVQCT